MNARNEITRNPYLDWTIVLAIGIFLTIALAINGFYLYNAVTKGGIEASKTAPAKVESSADAGVIPAVIDRFSVKEMTSSKVKAGYSGPGDPSV